MTVVVVPCTNKFPKTVKLEPVILNAPLRDDVYEFTDAKLALILDVYEFKDAVADNIEEIVDELIAPDTKISLSNLTLPLISTANPLVGIVLILLLNLSVLIPIVPSLYIEIEDDCHKLPPNK